MKSCFTALLVVTLLAGSIFAGERVERFIESGLPIIIDGNWVYPENGGYKIVMTDSILTVNGIVYYRPKGRPPKKYVPPSKEKSFFDWIIRETLEQAQQIVDSGGSPEEAREYMDSLFTYYADGDTFRVSYDKHRNFRLFHINYESSVVVPVPKYPRRKEPEPSDYKRKRLESKYKELCSWLENGFLIFRRTDKNAGRTFHPSDIEQVIKELKSVPEKAVKTTERGQYRYHPMLIAERYKLTPSDIEILVSPKRLKRR